MKMRAGILSGVTGLVVLAGASTLALAATDDASGRPHRGEIFAATDTNKDGVVTKDEFKARGDEKFSKLDTNKDGVVTKEEMTQEAAKRATEHAGKRFDHMDSNKDGKISQAEFDALGDKRFARLDENGDGKLEKGEGRHSMMQGRHGPDGDMPPPEDGAVAP